MPLMISWCTVEILFCIFGVDIEFWVCSNEPSEQPSELLMGPYIWTLECFFIPFKNYLKHMRDHLYDSCSLNKNSSATISRLPFIKLIMYSTRFVIIKIFIKKIFASTLSSPSLQSPRCLTTTTHIQISPSTFTTTISGPSVIFLLLLLSLSPPSSSFFLSQVRSGNTAALSLTNIASLRSDMET